MVVPRSLLHTPTHIAVGIIGCWLATASCFKPEPPERNDPIPWVGLNELVDAQGRYPVISVTHENIGWNMGWGLRLGIWENGLVIWNTDLIRGQGAYLKATINPETLIIIVEQLCKAWRVADIECPEMFGLHTTNSILRVDGRACGFTLVTDHEDPGVRSGAPNARERLWNDLLAVLLAHVPPTGEPCDKGAFLLRRSSTH